MTKPEASLSYLRDLGFLLKEMALKTKAERDSSIHDHSRTYAEGRLMALHEVISPMQQQAEAFDLI